MSLGNFKTALRYRWLTQLYDPLMHVVLRRYNYIERILNHLNIQPGCKVLDLGCGTATLCIAMKTQHPRASILGLDGDAQILQVAQRKVDQAGCDVSFVHGLSFAMPFGKNTFDMVVSSLLFHHLSTKNKRRTLQELRRILKPNGTLLILDWGKPKTLALRLAFLSIQIFDGFDTTSDNVRGFIPGFMEEAGFTNVIELEQMPTLGGSLSFYKASNT